MAMVTKEAQYKTISPFDLTSGDNPGAVISQPLLNGLNYEEWARNLRMALSSRKKFGFLDGSIQKPKDDDPKLEDWTANNHLLIGWIKLTIEPRLRSSISTREVAKDLWDIIKKRFSVKSGARLQQLRNSLATCKQNGSSVDDYFGRLTKIWDAIEECMSSKRCTCGKCECDLNTAHDKEKEILRVHDFLAGLDDSVHGVIRSQVCVVSPLPDLDTVYQTILQNETIRMNVDPTMPVMGFASQAAPASRSSQVWTRDIASGGGSQNRDPSRLCSVCGKMGHDSTSCFKVIGYPEWWQDKSRGRGGGKGSSRDSAAPGRVTPRANSTQIPSANSAAMGTTALITDNDRVGLAGLTDEQWSVVQRIINAGKSAANSGGKNIDNIWILDTGATHHMTGRIDLLTDIRDISPLSVILPADSDAYASKQGTVHLTSGLSLQNDRASRMLIGAGEREGEGLYRFRSIEEMAVFQTSISADMVLWHHRLGHPSSQITGIVPGVSSYSSSTESLLKKCDRLYDLERHIIFTSRDVIFHETEFPFTHSTSVAISNDDMLPSPMTNIPVDDGPVLTADSFDDNGDSEPPVPVVVPTPVSDTPDSIADNSLAPPPAQIQEQLGRGCRTKIRNVKLHDYVVDTISGIPPPLSLESGSPPPQSSSGSLYPLSNYVSIEWFSPNHRKFVMALTTNIEPRSFLEAMKHKHWENAVNSEYNSLEELQTWRLEDLPPNKKALGCKWVFTTKYRSDGTIERYKARLVVRDDHQEEGFDYDETFAPVAMMKTVRTFLDYAAKKNHEVHQMDVHNAFLHGDLHDEVYMKLPPGFRPDGETRVCRLQKSLYGLKQAS
ncbi:uncharacterized protein LOC112084459 [Eutrema salsugineum]|uniref:uncharacterized protein LOC112084459 n=1 Tax=Eutrema salsugineum TaxID=72664 RepID=UPI000CED59AC|nr:uncharacterized protein LOC112084459 [Eutrema salsugineum]